jgi:hypothetical protein
VTGQAVAFDASSSTCQDSPCTYTWQDDGPDGPGGSQWALGTGQQMSFTFQQTGTKWVRLIVTDVNGDTNSTMQTITVGSPSAPPPAPAPVQNGQLLVGSSTVQNVSDSDSSGTAEAFMATAVNSGTTAKLSVYVNSGNGAKTLIAGIYSDSGGHPGSLLTKGTVSGLTSQAWNTLTVSGASLASGQKYWLAILGTGGTLAFRDAASSSCHSETSASNSLTTLPSSWRTGRTWGSCPVSGYATN